MGNKIALGGWLEFQLCSLLAVWLGEVTLPPTVFPAVANYQRKKKPQNHSLFFGPEVWKSKMDITGLKSWCLHAVILSGTPEDNPLPHLLHFPETTSSPGLWPLHLQASNTGLLGVQMGPSHVANFLVLSSDSLFYFLSLCWTHQYK